MAQVVYQIYLGPLAAIPGPFLCELAPSILQLAYHHGRMFELSKRPHARYRPTVRLGCHTVSVADPATLQAVYGSYDNIKTPRWYQECEMFGEGFFTTARSEFHRMRKRVIQPAFAVRALRAMESSTMVCRPVNLVSFFFLDARCQETGTLATDDHHGSDYDAHCYPYRPVGEVTPNLYYVLALLSAGVIADFTLGRSVQLLAWGHHPVTDWLHALTHLVVVSNAFPFLKTRWAYGSYCVSVRDF
ncbi:hypothetical protein IWQ60_006389 [Tieghemiomyces parasiticus]|uniref:Cytochrome P450 n=1 Tax=Tieghemiomyces parasiticus TaxID=78921 RepID=A0A9W8AA04_9FUNG|nr:hypothetical protein IWQ60_006389 [Tieghemiomyces parasiticus]